ncbi:EF-hand domain-containing protein [Microtetraspora niveoalba]|uniref:EF-hand domain-containing protein n=1 Tax=Microtetraspora niveoalba TaxID=46175 RepID=UPI000AAF013B|nr:EF-hand domain-containing protein [Microtetraspora niveoalba]
MTYESTRSEGSEVSEGVLERLRFRFRMLDTDGNGYLEGEDFERLAADVLEAMDEPAGSQKGRAVFAGHRRYWEGLRDALDVDGDGRISPSEYIARLGAPVEARETVADYAESLAALADRDGDGFIELGDFLTCMTALGFHRANCVTLFTRLDEAGDGRVPVDVWAATIVDYYTSASTDIPVHGLTAPAR